MKYLSHYLEPKQTKLFKEYGVFFAFSTKQFDSQKQPDTKYINLGAGMLCPENNVKTFTKAHSDIIKEAIQDDIDDNGIENIIKRELENYECYYTNDLFDCVNALEDYKITQKQIIEIYNQNLEGKKYD